MVPERSVVLGLWQDRPPEENLAVAEEADALGYRELWIGEMATYDAFGLATAIGLRTRRIELAVGPLAVAVRTPTTVAMGAATVASLTGRRVGVALGTSSDVVVEQWHGRSRTRPARALAEHAIATRTLLSGAKADVAGARGYRLRLPPVDGPLSIAAFGPAALDVAAAHADRLVLNMVTPATAGELVARVTGTAETLGRRRPRVAVWLPAATDPQRDTIDQLRRGVVGYLAAPGYRDMFTAAGFGGLVTLAASGPLPQQLLAAVPDELIDAIGLVGSTRHVEERIAGYGAAGVDEVCLVPATAGDDAGRRTLTSLAPSRGCC